MDLSEIADEGTQKRVLEAWKGMGEADKGHFINQVALALSIWGSDEKGRVMVVEVLRHMVDSGSRTLADFGLYIDGALRPETRKERRERVNRVLVIIEGYRIKNALSSVPHREIG